MPPASIFNMNIDGMSRELHPRGCAGLLCSPASLGIEVAGRRKMAGAHLLSRITYLGCGKTFEAIKAWGCGMGCCGWCDVPRSHRSHRSTLSRPVVEEAS